MHLAPTSYCLRKIPSRIILLIALLTPLTPKLIIASGIFVYLVELVLMAFLIVFFQKYVAYVKFQLQRIILLFGITLLLYSVVSQYKFVDLSAILRGFKILIYVPLVFVAYYAGARIMKPMLLIGLAAMTANLLHYLLFLIPTYGLEFWLPDALPAGFSNRYLSLAGSTLPLTNSGAHGVWGGYCVLILALAHYLRHCRDIPPTTFVLAIIAVFVSLSISVSRASVMTLAIYYLLLLLSIDTRYASIKGMVFVVFTGFVVWALATQMQYFSIDQIGIAQKISHTLESFQQSGTESNIQTRINTWLIFGYSLLENPITLLNGLGYNKAAYYDMFTTAASSFGFQGKYVSIPESLIIFGLLGGGLAGFLLILMLLAIILKLSVKCYRSKRGLWFLGAYLLSIIPANIFSGANLIADLLYGQFLILTGVIFSLVNWQPRHRSSNNLRNL